MRLVDCSLETHGEAILDILNDAIVHSTALYDYKPRTMESMHQWFAAKQKGSFPVIGIESDSSELLGFASYGTFRAWPAYKYSVEHSIYVREQQRRKGIGKRLLGEIIEAARKQSYHVLVGGIDVNNRPSIALHEQMGFRYVGTIEHAGFKFGRWLDLAFFQLTLETPHDPVDG